jgi:hypothetical protein
VTDKSDVHMILMSCLTVIGIFFAIVAYGKHRWKSETKQLRTQLEKAKVHSKPATYNENQIENLPVPVQRYFRNVLSNGQRIVAAVSMNHQGSFNMGKKIESWKAFTSTQRVITCRPGFDWDASIAMLPGISVYVHDAYIAGEGLLHAAVLGLVSMANFRGPGETARGELMRFFAETAWYPTALLPSQGVVWKALNSHSANATMTDGKITLSLLFRFNDEGLIDTVSAKERGQIVGGKIVMVPWQARLWNYQVRDRIYVPIEGEVSWMTADGAKPYWRGQLTSLQYEFAR